MGPEASLDAKKSVSWLRLVLKLRCAFSFGQNPKLKDREKAEKELRTSCSNRRF